MNELKNNAMYKYLMVLTIAAAMGLQTWRTLFNNFAVEKAYLLGHHIGVIQSVREIPGFLTLLAIYVMLIVKEHRLSALSIIVLGFGVGLTGFFPSYYGLIFTTLVMSFGFHYFETTNQSLTLQYFDMDTAPKVIGKLRGLSSGANIIVGLGILAVSSFLPYKYMFLIVGGAVLILGLWAVTRDPTEKDLVPQHKKMIFKKKYWLYYFLTLMAGARRQVFVAFAVFLMVKVHNFSVQEITILFVVNNAINYFVAPQIGRAIVRFGERKVLSLEYGSLILIFLAYAFVSSRWIVALLYIFDHIFFNFAIAIRTYFQKIGEPQDIAPSMAVGFTINHIAAVVIPALGGLMWMIDYRIPFVAGAVLSLVSLGAVQLIKLKPKIVTI
jgi:predicted MFS family arabinose efflux permease